MNALILSLFLPHIIGELYSQSPNQHMAKRLCKTPIALDMWETQDNTNTLRLSDEDIKLLNSRAAKIDTAIITVLIAVGAVFGAQYALAYNPPISGTVKSAILLDAQDFIADSVFNGAEISQEPEKGALVAEKDGEVVKTYDPEYGGVILNISSYSDGSPRYDIVFDEDGLYN